MSHYTQDQIIADLKRAQAFEDKVFGDMGDTLFKEAAECIEQLRAQLEQITKERDEARKELIELSQVHQLVIKSRDRFAIDLTSAKIRAAEFQEQRDAARAQRDRAMILLEECSPPDKAHDCPCHPDAGCDSSCSSRECWVLDYIDLKTEIAKEKEEGNERR